MKPYLFLHIPKTGGSSVVQCLPNGRCSLDKFFVDNKKNEDLDNYGYGAARHHYTLEQMEKIETLRSNLTPQLYKFVFVRNPWDRVVSIFHDWKEQNARDIFLQHPISGLTYKGREPLGDEMFSQFVSNILTPVMDLNIKEYKPKIVFKEDTGNYTNLPGEYIQPIDNCPFYYTIANGHFTPQIKYTHNSSGDQVVDFIGKYETLQEDYDKLNEICGWNFKFMTLPHANKSQRAEKDYRRYYEDGSGLVKHLVSEIYREDIETYGYTF